MEWMKSACAFLIVREVYIDFRDISKFDENIEILIQRMKIILSKINIPTPLKSPLSFIENENETAIDYFLGRNGKEQNLNESIKIWTKLTEQNHADAMAWLSYCYRNAYGNLVINDTIAHNLLQKSAALGNKYALGVCFSEGIGCTKDFIKGFDNFKKIY